MKLAENTNGMNSAEVSGVPFCSLHWLLGHAHLRFMEWFHGSFNRFPFNKCEILSLVRPFAIAKPKLTQSKLIIVTAGGNIFDLHSIPLWAAGLSCGTFGTSWQPFRVLAWGTLCIQHEMADRSCCHASYART